MYRFGLVLEHKEWLAGVLQDVFDIEKSEEIEENTWFFSNFIYIFNVIDEDLNFGYFWRWMGGVYSPDLEEVFEALNSLFYRARNLYNNDRNNSDFKEKIDRRLKKMRLIKEVIKENFKKVQFYDIGFEKWVDVLARMAFLLIVEQKKKGRQIDDENIIEDVVKYLAFFQSPMAPPHFRPQHMKTAKDILFCNLHIGKLRYKKAIAEEAYRALLQMRGDIKRLEGLRK